jgi:copper(I)-binding protein
MKLPIFASIALAIAAPSAAQTVQAGKLSIQQAWARQTAVGQANGGAFMKITNAGKAADRLLSATSPVAGVVEVHTMSMDGGVMRMRAVPEGLPVPAGGTLELKPGGYHIMLIGLKSQLKPGEQVPLTLKFEKAGTVPVQVKIQPVSFGMEARHDKH